MLAQQCPSMQAPEHWVSFVHVEPFASLQSMSCVLLQVPTQGEHEVGQNPSEAARHCRIEVVHWKVQLATTPLRVRTVLLSLTHMSNCGWQLVWGGSQVSFGSMIEFPHTGLQLLSLLALQPPGQQESPLVQVVMVLAFTHSAVQAAAVPCSVRSWQPTGGQLVGQLAPSHFSPHALSVTLFPQLQVQSLSLVELQVDGQQPSLFVQAVITVLFTHWALQVDALPCSVRRWQPTFGQDVGQLPSHSSPISTTPFPQAGVQLLSLLALQLVGQQPSPDTQVVWVPSSTQAAVHADAMPTSFLRMQPDQGQVVGQLVGGSQLSPDSTTPLPQLGVQSLSLLALQPDGQQLSPPTQVVFSVSSTQRAWQVPPLTSRRSWQPMAGHDVGQLLSGSQVSWHALSTTPLPHVHWQSESVLLLHPVGQQLSPPTHTVCTVSSTQRAVHWLAVPVSFWRVQPIGGQLVGQLEGGSQFSPVSIAPLPQLGWQSLSLVALQPEGQQLSPPWHSVWVPLATHWAWQVPALTSLRRLQPTAGHDVGQLLSGSQVSPASTVLLPQVAAQSLSLATLQPGGQQLSPEAQVVCMPLSTQRDVQLAADPCSVCFVQPIGAQVVGQVDTGSQVSPVSTVPLPHIVAQSLSLAALQAGGQQLSPFTQAVCMTSSTHWAWQLPPFARRRSMQPLAGQVVGQLDSGSHFSPQALSTVPLPQTHEQSASFAVVQPDGQHESPVTHAV